LTRLYVGLDPRRALDAFTTLVKELHSRGILPGIQVCLNLESMHSRKISNDSIVIYVNKSQDRQELLDKILAAYKAAKRSNISSFSLTPQQRDALLGKHVETYRAIVDSNLTFVEMASDEANAMSWDAGGVQLIDDAIGMSGRPLAERTHQSRIQALMQALKKRIWTRSTSKALEPVLRNPDSVQEGTEIQRISKRNLQFPALVNYTSDRLVKKGGKFEMLPSAA